MTDKIQGFLASEVDSFLCTAFERQKIYILKKFNTPKPWTNDPIFQQGFFCNVFRDQDKTTDWFIKNIYRPYATDEYLWTTVITCRYLSNIATVSDLNACGAFVGTFAQRMECMRSVFKRREEHGLIINTHAFKLPDPKEGSKPFYLIKLLEQIKQTGPFSFDTLESAWHFFIQFYNVDSFIAFQYVMDLTYTRYLENAPDLASWAAYGRGSTKGLARLLTGTPTINSEYASNFSVYAQKLLDIWLDAYHVIHSSYAEIILETIGQYALAPNYYFAIMDHCDRFLYTTCAEVEHWLCEYDKYKDDWAKRLYKGA